MEKKINIAEYLKDCPNGMELDCLMYENLYFDSLNSDYYGTINCYTLIDGIKTSINFTKYGTFNNHTGAKCVIFPKGKTTWDGFVPPCQFKNGDVLVSESGNIVLLSHIDSENIVHYHCIIPTYGSFRIEENTSIGVGRYYECVLANEQQKQRMYDKIKSSGYKYNQSTNKLENLNEQKFNDGDVLAEDSYIFIIQKIGDNCTAAKTYCTLYDDGDFDNGSILYFDLDRTRLATEEEKQKLFDAIKENGYKWNAENKTLEKFVEPKFKVNDKIKLKGGDEFGIITQVLDCFYTIKCKNNTHYWSIKKQDDWELINEPKFKVGDVIVHIYRKHLNGDSRSSKIYQITNDKYIFTDGSFIYIQDQNKWELVPNKFDITTLKPFESRVLVRNSNGGFWQPTFWGIYEAEKANEHHYRNYLTTKGFFRHCIPYNDDTKHLLGTTDDCDDYFKTWE